MPAVPQKIRSGLLELRTDVGPVYVGPSFWERIYLLWTFRNFHSLPRQVLNRHQLHLIDRLCWETIVHRNGPIARSSIIGAVENVHLMPDCKTEAAATTSKLVEMSATSADIVAPRAVGSEGVSIRSTRAAYNRTDIGRFRRRSANVQFISAPKQDCLEQSKTKEARLAPADSDAGRTRNRNRLRLAMVAACGAALVGTLFYFREGRLAPPITVPQVAVEPYQPAWQSMPAERNQPSKSIAFKEPSPAVSSRQHESTNRKTMILTQPPVATKEPTPAERPQVAEAPENGFSYPVAQNPTLIGKVCLKAVIGTDGTVRQVDVVGGNRALAGDAVRAVRHWRFRPYALKGHAVEAEANITISFVGDDAVSISFPAAH